MNPLNYIIIFKKSNEMSDKQRKTNKFWCGGTSYKRVVFDDIIIGLRSFCTFLSKHRNKPWFVLIDELKSSTVIDTTTHTLVQDYKNIFTILCSNRRCFRYQAFLDDDLKKMDALVNRLFAFTSQTRNAHKELKVMSSELKDLMMSGKGRSQELGVIADKTHERVKDLSIQNTSLVATAAATTSLEEKAVEKRKCP